ncbi:TetR-like C-terminal domain-containing protein [Methylobrevis albus]|uniref:TetR/AcrR family transcriptional regulator C-terminal ligand-binding domain-containing protein n=1 Tax=Methylobrevis albus TaxID=2793297 RepID=A0A931MYG8_9HYPH|nr:TetR-like C-terminal domain-containing protein [Methylobrevis albus]MBH0238402.1 TetR/AcrR family transcriptional regulator C-terminal ligand-binding domain-containing protein [Methylobrevis albus]
MERKSADRNARRKPSGAAVIRPELTTALFRALFEEWAESGYAALSLERVAARAGAGKAAIYRRWPSKLEFVCQAIQGVGITLSDFSDHGSLGADISAYLRTTRVAFRHPLIRKIIPDVVAERIRTPEVAEMLDSLTAARRQLGKRMLERAIGRNELQPALDKELALDLLISALYIRMIVHSKNTTMAEIHRLAIAIEAAIKAC